MLLSILMIAVNVDVFFRVLKPAYAAPRLIEGISQPQFCCLSDTIDCSKTYRRLLLLLKIICVQYV